MVTTAGDAVIERMQANAQAKPSTKITIMLPTELLEWASVTASVMRLERNDVLRYALAEGLTLLQIRRMSMTSDEDFEKGRQFIQRYGGIEGFIKKLKEDFKEDVQQVEHEAAN